MENAATRTEHAGGPDRGQRFKNARSFINVPPVVFVSGFVLFWAILGLFGEAAGIHVLKGKPHMPYALSLLAHLLLLGTVINFLIYPLIWFFLFIFKPALATSGRYFLLIWVSSGCALWFLGAQIGWLLD